MDNMNKLFDHYFYSDNMLNLTNILSFHLDKFVLQKLIMELNLNVEYILNLIHHMNILLHNNESKFIYLKINFYLNFLQTLSEQQDASGYGQHPYELFVNSQQVVSSGQKDFSSSNRK